MKVSKMLLGFAVLFVFVTNINSVSAFQYPDYLHSKHFVLYKGEISRISDLNGLEPVKTGGEEIFDLKSLEWMENYAYGYTAILEIPVDGNYLITQKAGDSCVVYLDGTSLVKNDGVDGRRPKTIEKLVPLKAGRHEVKVDYLLRAEHPRVFDFRVEGPDFYQVDKLHWLYFGWENDYPKTWSFMGGTVSPGRTTRIQFAVETDGKMYTPDEFSDDRRDVIKWKLAEKYLPCPISEWMAGDIKVSIQHFANRVLNDKTTAVFSQVTLTNTSNSEKVLKLHINSNPEIFIPLNESPNENDAFFMHYDLKIPARNRATLAFISKANGDATADELKNAGSIVENYKQMVSYYKNRINSLARPVELPNQELVTMYKAAQIIMWESIVTVENGDVEMRGSGGNPAGYYQYDRTFSHDVPNMVDQFIREGDFEVAKDIMESEYYQRLGLELEQNYLDAIPKYIIPYALYLQLSGDVDYFTPKVMADIKGSAHKIHEHRDFTVQGPYNGIMNKSHTLDNPVYYLIVDNFAALHGLASYKFICEKVGDTEEAKWAAQEMADLNRCFDTALRASMERRNIDWYMSTFDDDSYFWKNGYDGNWIGTTLMMSTFPWDASLRGFDMDGAWKEAFDRSIEHALHLRDISPYNIPERSWGAWWGSEYGACYNAGMGLQLLYSDKYRTEIIKNIEFLLDNQAAPYQWGESFRQGMNENDWTRPSTDYETWGLSYDKQALLESNVSVHSDGSVIIGRGIPEEWIADGKKIAWKDIRINNGKKIDFTIITKGKTVTLDISGDTPDGKIIFNLPTFTANIKSVLVDGHKQKIFSNTKGKIALASDARKIEVQLIR